MKSNYIDNAEFLAELEQWRDSSTDPAQRQPSERLGQILVDLHNGILKHKNFSGYRQDLKDEMKSYSLYRILKNGLFTFDFSKSPFSYFTRAVFCNYMNVIKRYYRRLNKHQAYVKGVLTSIDTHGDARLARLCSEFRESS